ncbi:MAG: xanthine dehydrogenase family protein molybdopterin-binding subunit [Acidimicrobiales bacterium]|nr:xanthine dehydrogenase family protein molybdopterin-binding subunit [Acidimicrobiales bacterium]MDG2219716.1 xanthine dehydrogenase family protein molybdopterin-binding subunit [Acidimicrobiales bacterium]
MSILGNRVQRVEDGRFLVGQGRFVPNVAPTDAAAVVFVRSTMAHANLLAVELNQARNMPGVLAAVDAESLGANPTPGFPPIPRPDFLQRHLLATDRVRFVGQPIAAIVADTLSQAIDAAEMVVVDYEPLDAVIDPRCAGAHSTALYDELGSNALPPMPLPEVPIPDFSDCDIVLTMEISNSRMNAAPIEPRVAAAHWHADDTLTCWSSTQGPHAARSQLAAVAGLADESVRVIVPDIGGGFGAKAEPSLEECALGCLSRIVQRPVLWVESRTENLQAMCHGRAQYHTITMGGRADGRITHYHLHNLTDAGYTPTGAGFLPFLTGTVAQGCYDIDHVAYTFETVVTNTSTIGAFRGAGRPEAIATLERAVDVFAAEVGIDPVEVRRRNFIKPDNFPFTTMTGSVYDSGRFAEGLRLACEIAGYEQLRSDQAARRESGSKKLLGIGVASFVEITAAAPGPQTEHGAISLLDDGSFRVDFGATAMGQGTDTTMAMIAADGLGVDIEQITLRSGDTDIIPHSNLTAGSRTTQVLGPTMVDASERMVEAAKPVAAQVLEAAVDDLVFNQQAGTFAVVGTPAISIDWPAIAAATEVPLTTVGEFAQESPTFPSGSNIAVVEVDAATGSVELLRLIAADDAGTIISPMLAEGQVHGGLATGVAQALYEEVVYDEDGNLLTSNFIDYPVLSAREVPSFETTHYETPSPNNPLGAKGIGESGTVGSTPAVQNAVIDAIRHLGVTHIDMPMTPQKVWAAITSASG